MYFDASRPLLDSLGQPLREPKRGVDGKPVPDPDGYIHTYRWAIGEALLGEYADEAGKITFKTRMERYELAQRVKREYQDNVHVTSEEVSLIKELLNKRFPSTQIVGQVCCALEAAGNPQECAGNPEKLRVV